MKIIDQFQRFLKLFWLTHEKESYPSVIQKMSQEIFFKGTNLWILVFAIIIACLGLNVNSTAIIIGAMLVSPLMGPIMGLGLAMAINDLQLLNKSLLNYSFAAFIGLVTSSLYFLISPLNEAHSEILARTSPNHYDVLIALFGGLAGMLATSSKKKGNVIPGVAIATALMPPLCTAGYGLATLQFSYFFGAFYLFIINTVFIALATFITARFLKFPMKKWLDPKAEKNAERIIWGVVLITLIPSIYLGYNIVQQRKFISAANDFIEHEAIIPNNYLLKKNIDPVNRMITLIYGGQYIEDSSIHLLKTKLTYYQMDTGCLKVRQGFAYLQNEKNDDQLETFSLAISEKEKQIAELQSRLDSLNTENKLSRQIFLELSALYPSIHSFYLEQPIEYNDTGQIRIWVGHLVYPTTLGTTSKQQIEGWLKTRLKTPSLRMSYETLNKKG